MNPVHQKKRASGTGGDCMARAPYQKKMRRASLANEEMHRPNLLGG